MVSKIEIIRDKRGGTGNLQFTHNGIKYFNHEIRTGKSTQSECSEWVRGVSGIPTGNLWLWNFKKHIQQYNDLDATGKEIGRFYPISSDQANKRLITCGINPSWQRWDIGLHDENDSAFSLGCPVVISNKKFRNLCLCLDGTPEGHIPLIVSWEK